MTSDFKPGKAYLIEGKSMEQVKSEIKEWFRDHNMELVYEKKDILAGHKPIDSFGVELWMKIKLIKLSKDTIIVFDSNLAKGNNPFFHLFQYLNNKPFLDEIRRNLVRYLLRKKEVKTKIIFPLRYIIGLFFLGIFLYFIYPYLWEKGSIQVSAAIHSAYILLLFIFTILITDILIILIIKNISLSDKYYIEEYKGEIEID